MAREEMRRTLEDLDMRVSRLEEGQTGRTRELRATCGPSAAAQTPRQCWHRSLQRASFSLSFRRSSVLSQVGPFCVP